MNIFKLLFEILIIYLVYKLIFDFIIPVYKTTRQMKDKIRQAQERMEQQQQQQNSAKPNINPKVHEGEYIDYEEVK
jgi:hypothetical protein